MVASKLVLITGGSSGLGFEAAKQLVSKGHGVILACRSADKARAAVQALQQHAAAATTASTPAPPANNPTGAGLAGGKRVIDFVQCDLESFDSVRHCAQEVLSKHPGALDVLLCNAGVVQQRYQRTGDGYETTFQVNHLSHFLLAHLLLPALYKSPAARVVVVSSELHKGRTAASPDVPASPSYLLDLKSAPGKGAAAGPGFQGLKIYGLSKLYNLWFSNKLASMLPPNVVANAVTPGFVPATGLSRQSSMLGQAFMKYLLSWLPFATTVEEGACVGVRRSGTWEGGGEA